MGVDTKRYIRKPLYVDAVRVTPKNFEDVAAWCSGEIHKETEGPRAGKSYIRVRVQYPKSPRQSKAFVGDWVLYTETGYKVYTNPAFVKSFDAVEYSDEERIANQVREREEREHGAATGADPEFEGTPGVTVEAPGETDSEVDEHTTPQGEPHEYVEATPEAIADVVNEQQPVMTEDQARKEMGLPPKEDRSVPVDANLLEDATPIAPPPTPAIVPPEPQPEPVSEQAPEIAAAGKHVLSEEEQRQMGPDKVREMLAMGDVILAQDLKESA